MLVLFAVAGLLVCVSETAEGQSDSTRRPPNPTSVVRIRGADSAAKLDIDSIEVIKVVGSIWDRLGPEKRRAMLDSLEARWRSQ